MQNTDMEALKDYVTAYDGHEHDFVADNIVCVLLTHNLLKSKGLDVRLDLDETVKRFI